MTQRLTLIIWLLLVGVALGAQTVVTDATLQGNTNYTWTADTEYILDGLVFLESGSTLTIEPGTVIKARENDDVTTGDNTTALIVTRGARIIADGTANQPIIFTADADDVDDAEDLDANLDRGLWGGLIILGNATIANSEPEDAIEGIASTELRARYGGTNDADTSGVLRYVSIRHGGAQLSQDNEINGLTLGAVGSGTVIDYVEVYANLDDGIEFFGGTVNVKHATVAFCGDDAFDYDQGWRGKGQFWFALQAPNSSTGRAGEHDGATPDGAAPFSNPTIYNATYIGIGEDGTATGGDANREGRQQAVIFRDNAAGKYFNSIFTGYNQRAIAIEDRDDTDSGDSYARFQAGDLVLSNNLFDGFGAGDSAEDIFNAVNADEEILDGQSNATVQATLASTNEVGATGIANIGRFPGENLDPRINAGGAALTGGLPNDDDEFFNIVSYRGAFGNSFLWLEGWTALDANDYLGNEVERVSNNDCIVIQDGDLRGGETYNWGGGQCYTLDGLVFLEADATLNIEAGTVIRALSRDDVTTGDNTSALIITRDAQIFARGTAQEPIIFTAEIDELDEADDLDPAFDRGLWGGIIILGNATIANSEPEDAVEGIASTEPRARYGGNDDTDNSGVLNYVSIRYGGAQLSQDNEINGLTLGAVGSGTTIDYVEVFANLDDGIEWFGGTVVVDHAAVALCGDDAFDYDQGWRGGGQYWFSLQGDGTSTGRAGEHDGATPDGAAPFSQPYIANATYVGIGEEGQATGGDANREGRQQAVIFRDNAAGTYINSIFYDFNNQGIAIEDRDDTDTGDSYARFLTGDLVLINNLFSGFGAGNDISDILVVVDQNEQVLSGQSAELVTRLSSTNSLIDDPSFVDDDRDDDGFNFDPRPNEFGVAASGAFQVSRPGFENVMYRGAFAPALNGGNGAPSWLGEWTAITSTDLIMNMTTSNRNAEAAGYLLEAPAPNPAGTETQISFTLPHAGRAAIDVMDITGRRLATLQRSFPAGPSSELLDVRNLPNGSYFVIVRTGGYRLIQKLVVSH